MVRQILRNEKAASMAERDKADRSQTFIEENLKRVYQETLDQEVPDRFKDLLDKLRVEDGGNQGSDQGKDGDAQ